MCKIATYVTVCFPQLTAKIVEKNGDPGPKYSVEDFMVFPRSITF